MAKIKWSEEVTNEDVLGHIREERTLLNNILSRNPHRISHIIRINSLIYKAIEGHMTKAKGVGTRKTHLLDDLKKQNILRAE
jgi:hypothetical protein